MAAPGPSTGGLHSHSEPPAVDPAVEAACVAALLAPHDAAVARMQSILGEIRQAQAASKAALGESCRAIALSKAAEELQHAVGYIPVYTTRAQAAAKEMRALRARVDRAVQRASALEHSATTGAPLLVADLGAFAEASRQAAAGLTSNVTSGLSTTLTDSLSSLSSALWGGSRAGAAGGADTGVMAPPEMPPGAENAHS